MSVFYVTGSTENKNGAVVQALGTTSRTDFTALKPSYHNLKADGNKAIGTADQTTILQGDAVSLLSITGADGYVALRFGSAPSVGNVYNVTGASYPYNGTYRTIGVSGNYALTSTQWVACTGIGTSGVATLASGSMDSDTIGDFIIMGATDEIAGQTNEALKGFKSNDKETLHEFIKYRNHVYAEGWQAFTGSVSKCDVTTTNVTLNADHGILPTPVVVLSIGTKVQAADLEQPYASGLRDPA